MGAGKSTALEAARRAGLETTEIDELMEESLGMPIAEAFERDGEEAFRAREAEVVGELLENADGGVIALGGGSVLSERIRAALGRHTVVWLQVDAAEAWRRIAHSNRPLATSAADVEALLAERLPLYEELADAVVPMGQRAVVDAGAALDPGLGRSAGRDPAAVGGERLGRVPDLRRLRPARRPSSGRSRAAASASPTATSPPSTPSACSRCRPRSRWNRGRRRRP